MELSHFWPLLALALAGCGDAPTRSGASTDPVVLTSDYGQAPGGVGADVLDALVSDTAEQAVSVSTPRASTASVDEEGDAIAALQAGDLDVTVVRADRLATAGADSLAVLQAPFLVTSAEQADRVAADPVAQDLMAGLDEIGLVGLALVPGGLRHPFGYAAPLLVPDGLRRARLQRAARRRGCSDRGGAGCDTGQQRRRRSARSRLPEETSSGSRSPCSSSAPSTCRPCSRRT